MTLRAPNRASPPSGGLIKLHLAALYVVAVAIGIGLETHHEVVFGIAQTRPIIVDRALVHVTVVGAISDRWIAISVANLRAGPHGKPPLDHEAFTGRDTVDRPIVTWRLVGPQQIRARIAPLATVRIGAPSAPVGRILARRAPRWRYLATDSAHGHHVSTGGAPRCARWHERPGDSGSTGLDYRRPWRPSGRLQAHVWAMSTTGRKGHNHSYHFAHPYRVGPRCRVDNSEHLRSVTFSRETVTARQGAACLSA